jgi:hypothetical protein
VSFVEHRVTTAYYGTLPGDSPLLVPVPTVPSKPKPERLHKLAAEGFVPLAAAIKKDLGLDLQIVSGWRPHRWTSWNQYVAFVTKKYGSLTAGRNYLGFNSPHEVGLAMDIGIGGLWPDTSTMEKQKQTPIYKWLVEHAWEHGWTNFKKEQWHWEFWVDIDSYKSGVITKPCVYTTSPAPINDVCEDNTCFASPLLDDGSSLVCK